MRYRIVVTGAVTFALLVLAMPAAVAAAPGNDDFANATVVNALPFSDSVNTADATVEGTDPSADCTDSGHTVWYAYTPSSSGWFEADTFGSDYDTTLSVWTGTIGNLTQVACNDDSQDLQSKVFVNGSASTTYHIMAGSCCSPGTSESGTLSFHMATSGPPFSIDDVTIAARGAVNAKTGVATISGTITCSNGPGDVELDVFVEQRIGRTIVQGDAYDFFSCDGTQSWSEVVQPYNGLFVAGRASAGADAYGYDTYASAARTVRLRGR